MISRGGPYFTLSHLICTLIFENEGLDLYHRSEKNSGDKLKKNSGVQELKFF